MKKYLPYILIGAAVLWGIVFTTRACKITDSYSKLKGEYESMRKVYDADAILKDSLIAAKEKAIADLSKQILDSEKEIGHLTTLIGQRDADLAALRQSWGNLSLECQGKLHELDNAWGAKYTLLEGVVQEKDKQIADWAGKYDAQVTISETYQSRVKDAEQLLRVSESLNKTLETKYKILKVKSSFKTVAVAAAVGFVGYTLLKGK
jgi:chromosome segregation ATPase